MGRQSYYQVGYGFTEREARADALADARAEHGHEQGYSGSMDSATTEKVKCLEKPVLSKTCKVEKQVQKGARKWETIFVIEPSWGGDFQNRKVLHDSTQAKAVAEAKRMALSTHKEYVVRIEKQLVQGNEKIAKVTPKKAKQGKWAFSGEARC